MSSPFSDIFLIIIGSCGFTLCMYIFRCKHKKQPLVCPLRGSCDFVTTSPYSRFLGVHLEVLGMIYYAAVVLIHIVLALVPSLANLAEVEVRLVGATFAFIFSLYLTGIQTFVLKKWCTWCLCSAFLCLLIFLITYYSIPVGLL